MHFLHHLREFNLLLELLILVYTTTIQTILCTSITIWSGLATKQNRNRLKQKIRTAEKITGAKVPTIQDCSSCRVRKKAWNISTDSTPWSQPVWTSSLRQAMQSTVKTEIYMKSFSLLAITLINTSWTIQWKYSPGSSSPTNLYLNSD